MAFFGLFKSKKDKALSAPDDQRGWTQVFDWNPGAWQAHASYQTTDSVLGHPALFGCIGLISADIGKLRPTIQRNQMDIWQEVSRPELGVLNRPNNYQNGIQFRQSWINSKLTHGNTYVFKEMANGRVTALHILDPDKVTPLISDSGEVFYKIAKQKLAKVSEENTFPARLIIHDRWHCLYHPLIGLPPIYAAAQTARIGLTIQNNSKAFFSSASNPGGILSAPGAISNSTAQRLKEYWENKFTGDNSGRVAVAGDGLKYEPMRMTNVDAQMIENLRWTAETVCTAFRVPPYMLGIGKQPTHNNVEALQSQYYGQCLQILIEAMESALDEGLMIPGGHRIQLDLDGLLRMDSMTKVEALARAVGAGILSPNEARRRLNHGPVEGGNAPYLQQQNYSLEALANRDREL